jgi:Cu(I)-responsive transcriptional regulator
MTIGQLARQAGVGVQTVRYYERRRLLPEAPRRASGYRAFTVGALERLRFIRRAQELGFTLAEIAELLALRLDPHTTAADVKARAGAKIEEIDRKIHDLQHIKRALAHLAGGCRGGGASPDDCPLLEALGPLAAAAQLTGADTPHPSQESGMPAIDRELDCTLTVRELMQRHPATRTVFERFGVDTCCGSAVSVEEAARRDGLDSSVLCAELRAAARAG